MFDFAQKAQQYRQQQASRNALLGVLSNPDSIDPNTNLPTQKAAGQILRLAPEEGIKLQGEILDAQVKRAQQEHLKTEASKQNWDFMTSAAGIGVNAYDDAKKAGKSDDDARAAGQAARNDAVKNNGGVIGDDVADGIISKPFDPMSARALAKANSEYTTAQHDATTNRVADINAGLPDPDVPPAAAQAGPADPYTDVAAKIDKSENASADRGAQNPNSSATGNGQFTNSTWLDNVKAERPELVKAGLTDNQILALRNDPAFSSEMTVSNAKKNAAALSDAGVPVTGATVAAAHKLGPADAQKVITADPATPLSKILSPKVMAANPQLANQTAGQYMGAMTSQFGSAPLKGGDATPARVSLGKGAQLYTDETGTSFYMNPSRPGVAAKADGSPYTPQGNVQKPTGSAGGAEFTPKMGDLMAATAEQGVSLPTGFRSKAQQIELYQGLLDRNPDKTPDEIAKMLKTGQIEFGAQKKETQTAAAIAGKVQVAANELTRFVPLVRQASADLKRSNIKSLNQLVQTADSQLSDPKLKTLKGYIVGTLNAYDVLASRGGTDAEKRAENRQQLLSADGDKAINAALDVIMKEADIAHQASIEATKAPELADPSGRASSAAKVLHYDAQGNLVNSP